MGLYLLKHGTHHTGEGTEARTYNAMDPNNRIVESEEDLAKSEPGRFEKYDGPAPAKGRQAHQLIREGEEPPPGPTTDEDRAAAAAMKLTTPSDMKKRAEQLRKQADELEKQSAEAEKAMKSAKSKQAGIKEEKPEEEEEPVETAEPAAAPEEEEDDELDSKNVQELKDLARQEGIPGYSQMTKDKLVQAIREKREDSE
jgi:hypothetical protein